MAAPVHIIYGKNPVHEAIAAEKRIDKILLQEGGGAGDVAEYKRAIGKHSVQVLEREKFEFTARKLLGGKVAHQGVLAFLSQVDYFSVDDILHQVYAQSQVPFIVVCDGVTDVRNLGGIARSAVAFGAQALALPIKNNAQITPDSIKASAGALEKIMVCREQSVEVILKTLKAHGIKIVATDPDSPQAVSLHTVTGFSEPVAIVMGSEDEGISRSTQKHADVFLRIDSTGNMESLNVSVAAGIVLHAVFMARQ